MKDILIAVLLSFSTLLSAAAYGGEIQGRVLNAQGGAVARATVTVTEEQGQGRWSAVTGADGSYRIAGVESGLYTVTVTAGTGQGILRRQVFVGEPSSSIRADFQLPAAAVQQLSGAEERNPNIFINRIDWNDLRNRLISQRGPDPQYIPELRPEQNYFGAEYGAPLLAFEGLRPRPFLSQWRGSLAAVHQNSPLNARNFFNVGPLLPSRSTSFDITAGGPVVPDRLSLLLDFDQTLTSGFVNGNVQAPLAGERTALSANPQINAIIGNLLRAYPSDLPNLPSVTTRQLNSNAQRATDSTDGLARLDWRVNRQTSAALRYFVNQYNEDPFQIILGQNPRTELRSQAFYTNVTHNFSPTTVGRLGFHYDRTKADINVSKQYSALFASLGLPNVPDVSFRSGSLSSLGPGKLFPRLRIQNRFQFYAEGTKTMGRHTLTAGWGLVRSQVNDLQSDNVRGTLAFSSDFGNDEITNFLEGRPSSFTLTLGNLYRGFRNGEHSAYFGDQFRLLPTFSLSLGLRYELMTAPTEVNHLTNVNFPTDKNNLAPRFGFAWNPRKGKTTVRGTYGISYSSIFPVTYGMTRFNPPGVQVFQLQAPDLRNLVGLLSAASQPAPAGGQTSLFQLSPDLVFPYSHQYSLGIERELPGALQMRVAYFGVRSFHLLALGVYNRAQEVPGIRATTANINLRRADQRFSDINRIESNSNAYYDAFQASLTKRLSRGLTFRVSYTFSKSIDFDSDFTNTASGAESIPDIGTPSCELCSRISDQKGVSLFDTPQILVASYTYSLPFSGKGNRWTSALMRGWQISGTTVFQSGIPFHIHTGSDGPGFGNVDGSSGDRPNILDPSLLFKSFDNPDTAPLLLGADTCVPPTPAVIDPATGRVLRAAVPLRCKYFDTNIPLGGRGNLGFNTFRRSGTSNWNFALGRLFRLPGGAERSLQFRAEFYNLFNRAQFTSPNFQLSSDTFGKITNTSNKGRQVQFSLKLNF